MWMLFWKLTSTISCCSSIVLLNIPTLVKLAVFNVHFQITNIKIIVDLQNNNNKLFPGVPIYFNFDIIYFLKKKQNSLINKIARHPMIAAEPN